jgi:hypothetical protein
VIILPAAKLANVDPSADAAVVHGIGICLNCRRQHRLLKAALDASVVRAVVLEAELFLGVVAEDEGKVLRVDALDGR